MWVMRRRIRLVLFAVIAGATLVLASGSALGANVEPRVVGGTAASIDTYPWQGAVLFSTAQMPGKNARQRQFCAGSLVTPNVVVTAGHCVWDTDPDCSDNVITCPLFDGGGDQTVRIDPNDL